MSELKPCPFCGKVDELYSIPRFLEITKGETKEIEWAVGCKRCDVHLYRARYAKDEGIATWNTRPIEDELRAEIARRDTALNELLLLIEEHGAEHIRSHAKQIWKIRMYAKDEETFIRKSVADELAYLQRINYVYPKLQSKTLDEWEGKK